jgi:hypothetical protein
MTLPRGRMSEQAPLYALLIFFGALGGFVLLGTVARSVLMNRYRGQRED